MGVGARHTGACTSVDRAQRLADVGASRFCVSLCATEDTRTSRARAHHPNSRVPSAPARVPIFN